PSSVTAGWTPELLLHRTCELGKGTKQTEGTVWLKMLSKEVHGQFNASILALAPEELKLEITNFLGGTVALISVREGHYEITKGPSEPVNASGYDSWGGIPLSWATDLFLGKIPCPASDEHLVLTKEEANQLTVEIPSGPLGAQTFNFKYRKSDDGLPWPESLRWARLSEPKTTIEFKFDKPEQGTLSPLQWEASSSEGAIKVRWRDRRRSPSHH
ncbi:MAG: hypothetical protein ABIQ95_03225, partial [Bdellovibrionia bacterium]